MTDVGRDHHQSPTGSGPLSSLPSPTAAVFAVVLVAGLAAAGAAHGLGDALGIAVGAAIAVAGAVVAAMVAGKSVPPDVKAIALLEAVNAENAPSTPPSRFRGEPWASLYNQAVGNAEAQRAATLAVQEVETLRRELEQRPGAHGAFVPSPSHEDHELVGSRQESESAVEPSEPRGTNERAAALKALAEALDPIREELGAIERELEPVVASLQDDGVAASSSRDSTPAKMVDALVQTAADGIEDLAAGLMRASELAGVAERVTNRATLLALNAALEATRSGSEAFASIAEETRRLAEYAREATDTISRLSNEIETKVGETISSIQTSSEDAKAAVASIGPRSGSASSGVPPETVAALHALLGRVRSLRDRAVVQEVQEEEPAAARAPYVPPVPPMAESAVSPPDEAQEEEKADVHVTFVDVEERAHAEGAEDTEDGSPPDAHTAFGSVAFGGQPGPQPPDESAEPVAPEEPQASPEESQAPPEPHHAGDPASLVLPKIPDWLEGIEPRHRG